MNRPSHWILAFFAVMGPALWVWGLTEEPRYAQRSASATSGGAARAEGDRLSARPSQREVLLSGQVMAEDGAFVDGAQVRVLNTGSRALTRAGGFEVPVLAAEASLRVEVSADGFEPQVARCALGDTGAFAVALRRRAPWEPPAAALPAPAKPHRAGEGFVLDGAQRLVAGAQVQVLETGASALTDEIGRYRVALPAGDASLLVWDQAGRAATIAIASAHPSGVEPLPEVVLADGVELRGRLRTADGDPVAGAAVSVTHESVVRRARTDAGGTFTIRGLITGDWELEVLPTEGLLGLRRLLSVQGSGALDDVALEAATPRRVRVVEGEGDAAVAGVWVLAEEAEVRTSFGVTDNEGWVTLDGLGAGELAVREVRSGNEAERVLDIVGWSDPVVRVRP